MAKNETKGKNKIKKGKAAPPPVDDDEDELEDDDLELEELDEDEAVDSQPKKSKKSKASEEVTFGASDLAAHLTEVTGKKVTPRELRTQLRRMARRGDIQRTVEAGNRTRYNWSGPDDPEVKKIIKAVKGGEMETAKKEALEALKSRKAKKDADKPAKKATKKRAAVIEDDDEDEDDDE